MTHPTIDLTGPWQFAVSREAADPAALDWRPCAVPGNVELDLHANGLGEEPFFGLNIRGYEWLERAHVWYRRAFSADEQPGMTARLTFQGLDGVATLYLNGEEIGATDNALVPHAFDVTGRLRGENTLLIHFAPIREVARAYDYPPGTAAFNVGHEALYIRKAPHVYGWDIMPRAVSAGVWRPVSLEYLPPARIESLYLRTLSVDTAANAATLALHYRTTVDGPGYMLAVEGTCGASTFAAEVPLWFAAGRATISLADARLWWPYGYGEAALYDVTVRLLQDGVEVDCRDFRHGVRTVELLTEAREDLDDFCFAVNGERIFARGTNWVPLDAYHSRDAARLPEIFPLLTGTHGNMVRCWGGNVYEDDRFYDLCDAHGILVWQDFAMACAVYPTDDDFAARLREEATHVVRRLRQHACLALWSGDNECDWAYEWHQEGDPNRNRLTREVLPAVLKAEDPARPFLPSSPYIDARHYATGRPMPETHIWIRATWYKSIRDWPFRFASEIGYHGCPDPASIHRFISPEKVWPYHDNLEWQLHSTIPVPELPTFGAVDVRVTVMADKIRLLFGTVPDTLEDFAWASQAVQAEALKYFIELARGTKGQRTGILWWNLIDGWPQFSDAVVDYYLVKKRAYDAIARAQQPLGVLIGDPADGVLPLLAVNDTRADHAQHCTVRDLDGGVVWTGAATVPAHGLLRLADLPCDGAQHCWRIDWESDLGACWQHHLLGEPPYELEQYRGWMARVE
jgi:beta-mannosidase